MDPQLRSLFSAHGGVVRRTEFEHARIARGHIAAAIAQDGVRLGPRGSLVLGEVPLWWQEARVRGADLACVSAAPNLGLAVLSPPECVHVSHTGAVRFAEWHSVEPSGTMRVPEMNDATERGDAMHVPEMYRVQQEVSGLVKPSGQRFSGTGVRTASSGSQRPGSPIPSSLVLHRRRALGLVPVLAQIAGCLPELEALVIVESSLWRKKLSYAQLRHDAEAPGCNALRRILSFVDPGAESVPETVARSVLREAGLHVVTQHYVPSLGRLDLLVEGVLGVEVDGRSYHSSAESFREDRRRHNVCIIKGIPVLRVPSALVIYHRADFAALVRQAVNSIVVAGARSGTF